MGSGAVYEVWIQIDANHAVALIGKAGQISARATTRIEHLQKGVEDRREGGEGTGDRRRAERCEGIWVLGVCGDAVGDDIAGVLTLNLARNHSPEI